jgi:outer membrane protein assembly factor BamB
VVAQGSVYAINGVFVGAYNPLSGVSGLDWAYGTRVTDAAVDGQNVYFWSDFAQPGVATSSSDNLGVLAIANKNSGASPRSYPVHNLKTTSVTFGSPPVVGAMQDVLVATSMPADSVNYRSNDLLSINTQTGNVNWRYACTCTGAPAVAQGLVFVANNEFRALEVLDETTGALLWYWPLPGGINGEATRGSPLVTNNLAFISSNLGTYAIDLQTHQKVWSTSYTGALSLSANGVLYIYSPNMINQSNFGPQTTLAAFNLH